MNNVDNSPIDWPSIDWLAITPMIVLLGGALVLLVVGALTPRWPRSLYALATVVLTIPALVIEMVLWNRVGHEGPVAVIGDVLAVDRLALLAWIGITVATALVALSSSEYLRREQLDGPESYAMYVLAAIGGMALASANEFVVLFLGLETLSIALYVLAASHRRRVESQESGLKYFVLGGFASAFLLYGIALLYGATGTTNLSTMGRFLEAEVFVNGDDAMLLAGLALLLVGLGFKVAAVPFHFWTPDVYQGAPTPATSFMASVGKFAAFATMLRVLLVALPSRADDWRPVIWVMAIASVVIGSILAVVQTDVKRMLAYSSVSHAGFMLVGLEAAGHLGSPNSSDGTSASLLYVVLYSVLAIGSFAAVSVVSRSAASSAANDGTSLDAFRGIAKSHPAFALGFTVLLLAQAGVPLTSGFVAKFGVIRAAVSTESYVLAVLAMVSAVIAAYLYLRIMVSMWLAEPSSARRTVSFAGRFTLAAAVAITLVLGIVPTYLLRLSESLASLAR